MKPVLFVTGHVPAYRAGALERLHAREGIEVALFGGGSAHGGAAVDGELPFPHRRVGARRLHELARSDGYRAVVVPTGGRLALLAAWAGARRASRPLILWSSLWAHPRTPAHALSYPALLRLYRSADAVVTYGPHVSAYVAARGARNIHIAAQSVENEFWRATGASDAGDAGGDAPPALAGRAAADARFVFVGRPDVEKGAELLGRAWRQAALGPPRATLVLVGGADVGGAGVLAAGRLAPRELRDVYRACDVLVVPSIATRTFREPWGLVVNEAMNCGLAVIASDAVGAAAGGLVRDGENGLIVPAGDAGALADALARLAGDERLRATLGAAGANDVLAYDHDAWARGFSDALATLGLAREGC